MSGDSVAEGIDYNGFAGFYSRPVAGPNDPTVDGYERYPRNAREFHFHCLRHFEHQGVVHAQELTKSAIHKVDDLIYGWTFNHDVITERLQPENDNVVTRMINDIGSGFTPENIYQTCYVDRLVNGLALHADELRGNAALEDLELRGSYHPHNSTTADWLPDQLRTFADDLTRLSSALTASAGVAVPERIQRDMARARVAAHNVAQNRDIPNSHDSEPSVNTQIQRIRDTLHERPAAPTKPPVPQGPQPPGAGWGVSG